VNWLGNLVPRGIQESYGIMVNYLYDPKTIEANHGAFAQRQHARALARSGRPARRSRTVSPHRGPPGLIQQRFPQSLRPQSDR
jgi:malonyl-CoA decarboxylase